MPLRVDAPQEVDRSHRCSWVKWLVREDSCRVAKRLVVLVVISHRDIKGALRKNETLTQEGAG
jgi:hypothetical protein